MGPEETISEELVPSHLLRDIQVLMILLTLKTSTMPSFPPESLTFSSSVMERLTPSHSQKVKVSNLPLSKKEMPRPELKLSRKKKMTSERPSDLIDLKIINKKCEFLLLKTRVFNEIQFLSVFLHISNTNQAFPNFILQRKKKWKPKKIF